MMVREFQHRVFPQILPDIESIIEVPVIKQIFKLHGKLCMKKLSTCFWLNMIMVQNLQLNVENIANVLNIFCFMSIKVLKS